MRYMHLFEAEIKDAVAHMLGTHKIEEIIEPDNLKAFVQWVKNRQLESYKNGLEVGQREKPEHKKATETTTTNKRREWKK